MRKNIQTGSSGGINMTPMIDVVFQMIIFFVCTAQLEQEQFSKFIKLADSPNAPAVAEAKDPRTITIEVDGKGKVSIARTPLTSLGSGRLAGHEKGNGASVLRRRPEIILIGGVKLDRQVESTEWRPHGRSERELARDPELYRHYRLEQQLMPDGRILTYLRLREGDPGGR